MLQEVLDTTTMHRAVIKSISITQYQGVPITHYPLHSTYYLVLTTYYLEPTTYYLVPTNHYLVAAT